jgi:hypothetical protein
MAKVGRNDPCPCGSGKKYKNCHLPLEEAQRAEQLLQRRAVDSLVPKLIGAAREQPGALPPALERYWNGKYQPDQLGELDELEDRGADRFLTWFAFDYRLDDGSTLAERLIADPSSQADLDLDEPEAALLPQWGSARLRPYVVESVEKGQGMHVSDMLDGQRYDVEDHAASRRVLPGEVLVAHLLPAAGRFYIGGAVAHLTEDTREKLREFADLHLAAFTRERPEATWADLIAERSEVLNHFVMQLPVEAPDPNLLDQILLQTRTALQLTGESLGIGGSKPAEPREDGEKS